MKVKALLKQMALEVCQWGDLQEKIPEEACALAYLSGMPLREDHIYIMEASLADALGEQGLGSCRFLFCSGVPRTLEQLQKGRTVVCFTAPVYRLCEAAQQALRQRPGGEIEQNEALFLLLEGRYPTRSDAEQLLMQVGIPAGRRYCLTAVAIGEKMEQCGIAQVRSTLRELLPQTVADTVHGNCVVLLQVADPEDGPYSLQPALSRYLQEIDSIAAVSQSAQRAMALQVMIRQLRSVLRFGRMENSAERIFHYEEYVFYLMIERCAEAMSIEGSVTDVLYLCHPVLGRVMRYDRQNSTNLTEFLRCYLRSNCSIGRTAAQLYMHRNTALHRLERLEAILGRSLDDPDFRELLLLSFHVSDYLSKLHMMDVFHSR